mmetsp:Transcript_19704/g.60957  ORF Transcript_19704/g.60957 Transcript_19704/m.60957 type:complete len:333 (+) Transcript_19704:2535-3533(+)
MAVNWLSWKKRWFFWWVRAKEAAASSSSVSAKGSSESSWSRGDSALPGAWTETWRRFVAAQLERSRAARDRFFEGAGSSSALRASDVDDALPRRTRGGVGGGDDSVVGAASFLSLPSSEVVACCWLPSPSSLPDGAAWTRWPWSMLLASSLATARSRRAEGTQPTRARSLETSAAANPARASEPPRPGQLLADDVRGEGLRGGARPRELRAVPTARQTCSARCARPTPTLSVAPGSPVECRASAVRRAASAASVTPQKSAQPYAPSRRMPSTEKSSSLWGSSSCGDDDDETISLASSVVCCARRSRGQSLLWRPPKTPKYRSTPTFGRRGVN